MSDDSICDKKKPHVYFSDDENQEGKPKIAQFEGQTRNERQEFLKPAQQRSETVEPELAHEETAELKYLSPLDDTKENLESVEIKLEMERPTQMQNFEIDVQINETSTTIGPFESYERTMSEIANNEMRLFQEISYEQEVHPIETTGETIVTQLALERDFPSAETLEEGEPLEIKTEGMPGESLTSKDEGLKYASLDERRDLSKADIEKALEQVDVKETLTEKTVSQIGSVLEDALRIVDAKDTKVNGKGLTIEESTSITEAKKFIVVEDGVVKEPVFDSLASSEHFLQEEETEIIDEGIAGASIDEEEQVHMTEDIAVEKSELEDAFVPDTSAMKMEADRVDMEFKVAEIGAFSTEWKQLPTDITEQQGFTEKDESGHEVKPIDESRLKDTSFILHDLITKEAEAAVTLEAGMVAIKAPETPTKKDVCETEALSHVPTDVRIEQKEEEIGRAHV
jgi:hypothetical protein